MAKNRKKLPGNKIFIFLPFALSLFGLAMIFNASSATALANFNDKFYFFSKQAFFLILGIVLFFILCYFDYRKLKKIALPLFLVNIVFLILVLIPGLGREIYGGRRWLSLGFVNFQPAETVKLTLVIYLATILEKKIKLVTFLFINLLVLGLVMLEPDLGTAGIIIITSVCLYFVSGTKIKDILMLGSLGLVGLPVLILSSPYQKKRFLEYLNSSAKNTDISYHAKQILIALGSGGFFGRGFGQSRQKFLFLPEAATDSIFAIIAEEFGFFGAAALIILYLFLIFQGFKAAISAPDSFGKLLATGIIFFIGFQTFINFSSIVSIVPITGVPLPFISYGGSSLLVSLCGMGIVYNISRMSNNLKLKTKN